MRAITDGSVLDEAEVSAVLDAFVYMNKWSGTYKNMSLAKLCKTLDEENLSAEARTYLEIIKKAITNNKDLGKLKLVSHSCVDGNISSGELIACAFEDDNHNVYFAYRGTGDGKWLDNGDAMAKRNSLMQRRAQEYFDTIIEKNYSGGSGINRLIVTGHSKGGNSAQYVMMTSKYAHLVDACYSFDGQGFSKEAIEWFKEIWGDEYEAHLRKIYSINGKNDYVHGLGELLIPESNTYYIETYGTGIVEGHALEFFFAEDGKVNFVFTAQGPVGELVERLSEKMMEMDIEILDDCAITIMYLLEMSEGVTEGTGDRKNVTIEEVVGFLAHGLPLIVNTLIEFDDISGFADALGLDEDIKALLLEIQNYVRENNIEDFAAYIAEDPLRLLEIYGSLDLGKETIHKGLEKLISLASSMLKELIKSHPEIVALIAVLLENPIIITLIVTIVAVAVAVIAIWLIAKHIIANWDKIKQNFLDGVENVKEHVAELFTEIKNKVAEGVNAYAAKLLEGVEKALTVGQRIVNNVNEFMSFLKETSSAAIKRLLKVANPIMYQIAGRVYSMAHEPIRINMAKLKDCVNTMNRLATRVANIDSRLDSLYFRLAQNNIEQEEGVFTSIANMFNLFRADLNVDEGQAIKRRARALSEVFEDCRETDSWILSRVPKKI